MPSNNSYNDSVVMRLDVDTETPTLYKQPPQFAGKVALTDFDVSPAGRVWYLDEMKEGGHTVVAFYADGSVASETHLDTPVGLLVNRFKVAGDSTILVGGFFTSYAAKELQGKGYLVLFDKAGRPRKELSKDVVSDVDLSEASSKFLEGAVASGLDGSFYVLKDNEIFIISNVGEVVRRISIRRFDEDSHAFRMDLSRNLLSIEFHKPDREGVLHAWFLVLESGTGEPFGFYKSSEDLGDDCICFSSRSGYLFSRLESGRIKLLSAPLR